MKRETVIRCPACLGYLGCELLCGETMFCPYCDSEFRRDGMVFTLLNMERDAGFKTLHSEMGGR